MLCVCAFLGFLVEKPESFFLDINLNTFFKFSTSCTTHPSIFFFKRFVLVTKDFDWPLVRKVQHKSSPFTIYFVSQTLQLNEIHFCKAWIHKHVSLSLRTSSTTASTSKQLLLPPPVPPPHLHLKIPNPSPTLLFPPAHHHLHHHHHHRHHHRLRHLV